MWYIKFKDYEEWALVLVKDQVVVDGYNEFSKNFRTVETNMAFNKHLFAFKLGKEDGKNFDISNKIENEVEETKFLG